MKAGDLQNTRSDTTGHENTVGLETTWKPDPFPAPFKTSPRLPEAPMKCHWYSEFMLKRWRLPTGRIAYYDVDLQRIRQWKTGELFALEDLNSPEVEAALNVHESVVAPALDGLTDGTIAEREAKLDEIARPLTLLLLLQVHRTKEALTGVDNTIKLADTLAKGDAFLDGVVNAFHQQYRFGIVAIPSEYRLFVPDTGFFMFPIPHPSVAFTWGFAMPLTPTTMVSATPQGVDVDWPTIAKWVPSLSVGRSRNTKRIVVPPEYVEAMSAAELAQDIAQRRDATDKMFNDVTRARELAVEIHQKIGAPVPAVK